jgi:DNA-binding beta-propeller fold protein YncE
MSRLVAGILGWAWAASALLLCATGVLRAQPSLELVQTFDLKGKSGNLDHLVVDSKGGRLFMANKVNNTVDVVDLKTGKLVKQLTGQAGAQGVAYAPDLGRLYVGLGTGGFCNIFDCKNYKLLKSFKYMDDADNIRYSPRTHSVYVAHAEKAIGVIDGEALEQKTDISLPGTAEGFELETDRPRMYVCVPSPSQVVVIDTDKNEVVTSYPVKLGGANFSVAIDQANRRLFVGCRKKAMMVIMNSDTGAEIAGLPIPGGTDDVTFDAKRKRIYVSCADGFIAVIKQTDADHYESVENFATVTGAKTSYLDPETGRLYLAVPRQPGKTGPEVRVYEPK